MLSSVNGLPCISPTLKHRSRGLRPTPVTRILHSHSPEYRGSLCGRLLAVMSLPSSRARWVLRRGRDRVQRETDSTPSTLHQSSHTTPKRPLLLGSQPTSKLFVETSWTRHGPDTSTRVAPLCPRSPTGSTRLLRERSTSAHRDPVRVQPTAEGHFDVRYRRGGF